MHLARALLGLPVSLLLAFVAQAEQQQKQKIPIAVHKMMDEGDKFYPELHFAFAEEDDSAGVEMEDGDLRADSSSSRRSSLLPGRWWHRSRRQGWEARQGPRPLRRDRDETESESENENENEDGRRERAAANASLSASPLLPPPSPYLAPFALHRDEEYYGSPLLGRSSAAAAAAVIARLQGRDWGCPTGTASCSSIGYPYSCCATGETCYEVDNVGLGPVGCCPTGETCSGSVTSCASGTTACSESDGGGCCIAGYECAGVGCIEATVSTSTSTATATVSATSVPVTVVVVTVVVTQTASAAGGGMTTLTSTSTSTSTVTPTPTPTITTTTGGVAPVKPTSLPGSTTVAATTARSSSTSSTSSGSSSSYCPVGYYACLASAGGGCCQTGRDCQTTSCPPASSSTTVVNVNGITIAVPVDSSSGTAAAATCATGWFLCTSHSSAAPAGAAAGCCPSGYTCGSASCTLATASSSATATVQKELPSAASPRPRTSGPCWNLCWPVLLAVILGSCLLS